MVAWIGMTRDEIVQVLKANLNKTVTLKFTDGFVTPATPLTVHSKPGQPSRAGAFPP